MQSTGLVTKRDKDGARESLLTAGTRSSGSGDPDDDKPFHAQRTHIQENPRLWVFKLELKFGSVLSP